VLAGRTIEKGAALARELGGAAVFQRADVLREADIAALVDTALARFGRLDCMFNNAGAPGRGSLESVSEDDLVYSMKLLVGSALFGIKHAARAMKSAGGGSIINNSSIAGVRAGQGDLLYSIAKSAVSHLTRLAGVELGPHNIRVNAISPAAIATPIFWGGSERANALTPEENRRKQEKLEKNLAFASPLPRAGLAEDVAAAALFLASDEGSFVNCHDLVVDGGRSAFFFEKPRS
jgi:NAD(P)-dependent dehydrogenase (short-subunit alcohol dehydrogenase family)